jgi:hypothetical protein
VNGQDLRIDIGLVCMGNDLQFVLGQGGPEKLSFGRLRFSETHFHGAFEHGGTRSRGNPVERKRTPQKAARPPLSRVWPATAR